MLPLLYITLHMGLNSIAMHLDSSTEGMADDFFRASEWFANVLSFWLPVLNPLISIATNTPYRRGIAKMLLCQKMQIHPLNAAWKIA